MLLTSLADAPLRPPAGQGTSHADLVALRQIRESDVPFVRDSWVRSYRDRIVDVAIPAGCPKCQIRWKQKLEGPLAVSDAVYHGEQYNLVGQILLRCNTMMAHVPGDEDHLVGYVCYEMQDKPVLHYCYVKESFRRLGIGSKLFQTFVAFAAGLRCWASHWSWAFQQRLLKHHDITFNPYRGFYVRS